MKMHHIIILKKEIAVCVLADTIGAAKEIAINTEFDWKDARVMVHSCNQDSFHGDLGLIDDFKQKNRYSE